MDFSKFAIVFKLQPLQYHIFIVFLRLLYFRLTSKGPFIWVNNQTLPTKPNLSECLFLTSKCLFLTSECLFLTSKSLFLTSEYLFLTSECLFQTSESPFIWVYNQTLPTKPNLSESLFPMSESLFPMSECLIST